MFDNEEPLPARRPEPPSPADALLNPDSAAAVLTQLLPGPDAVLPLSLLAPARLSDAGAIDALVAIERQLAWLQAREQELIAVMARRAEAADATMALAGRPSFDPAGMGFLREELACALKVAPGTAQDRLDVAKQLSTRLAATQTLLTEGQISAIHARILADAVEHLEDAVTAKVQDRVLPRAAEQTPGEFRAAVRRAVARFDTRDVKKRHERACTDRRVVHTPTDDGMAEIWMLLAADGAATIMAALNGLAKDCADDDDRTMDQRRADAAVELAAAALHDPNLPTTHGKRPAVHVTIPLSTLVGEDDAPGELAGYGPIPAFMARRIAADPTGTWRRLIVDNYGSLLDYGNIVYRPPADLSGHVIARDQHCVLPTCRRSAWHCDLDHRVPFPQGSTSAENIEPLCRRHHTMKHHAGWTLTKRDDGSYEWATPTRHRYRYRPPEQPVPTAETAETATAAPPESHDPPPF